MDLRVENAEPLLKNTFGHQADDSEGESEAQSGKRVQSREGRGSRRKTENGNRDEREMCLSSTNRYLDQARAMVRVSVGSSLGSSFTLSVLSLLYNRWTFNHLHWI